MECFQDISEDSSCRAVVISGAGKIFTAGEGDGCKGFWLILGGISEWGMGMGTGRFSPSRGNGGRDLDRPGRDWEHLGTSWVELGVPLPQPRGIGGSFV